MSALLIYLHGFNSSPASYKARYLQGYLQAKGLADRLLVPELNHQPVKAVQIVRQLIETSLPDADITLIGSSLGGYYATTLAEQYKLRAVLINPAVYPYRLLRNYLGMNRNFYTQIEYEVKPEYMQQLLDMDVPQVTCPRDFLVLLQTADETLDYRDAAEKFYDAQLVIEPGGSHDFDQFDKVVPDILQFAGLEC
jgi:uncharacterized protein